MHREKATSDFLGIKNENWYAAARDLGAHAVLLYLYFASNKDNYTFALSPKAIREAVGMPPQTYRDQFTKLIQKGYLIHTGGNRFAFYEKSQTSDAVSSNDTTARHVNDGDDTPRMPSVSTTARQSPKTREKNGDTDDGYNFENDTTVVFPKNGTQTALPQTVDSATAKDIEININHSENNAINKGINNGRGEKQVSPTAYSKEFKF